MSIQFRSFTATSDEYVQAFELRNQILRVPLGMTLVLNEAQQRQEQASFHFGLFDNNVIVACCLATEIEDMPSQFQIRQMAVRTDHQNQGLGRQLLFGAHSTLQSKNASELMLHARDTAVGFYESLGYQTVGEPFVEIGIPHYEMRKKL